MLKTARRVDRVNHDRFLYKTAVALIIFTNFTLTVIGYNSIPWVKIEKTNTKQNNGSYAFDKVTKKGYLSNFQEDLDALFDFYHSKEKGSKRDKHFINAYNCAQAIGNVDTIEHLNANTKAINYNLRLNSESLLTLPTFFSIEPPGFYFSVIAIRIALKCILFGILVELIDPS
ncbi:unnamed protein product [Dibothriocephalus latus]|uniref:Uncharacterized protein n=1 Tax=Dibothriocephalus latus TaxID=60516 RepID=A0A3P7L572_DIBLA|nr:unnamed protein product [Dibothriocephalus latus]